MFTLSVTLQKTLFLHFINTHTTILYSVPKDSMSISGEIGGAPTISKDGLRESVCQRQERNFCISPSLSFFISSLSPPSKLIPVRASFSFAYCSVQFVSLKAEVLLLPEFM